MKELRGVYRALDTTVDGVLFADAEAKPGAKAFVDGEDVSTGAN